MHSRVRKRREGIHESENPPSRVALLMLPSVLANLPISPRHARPSDLKGRRQPAISALGLKRRATYLSDNSTTFFPFLSEGV
jgi:hypothetical protein